MTREEREIIEAIKIMGYDRTDYPREKVSAVISMTIEALKGGDAEMNEVKSPYMQHSPNGATHGRLIDADALMEYCSNQKTKTISNNDIARFPTAQADQPQGKWEYCEHEIANHVDGYKCSHCGFFVSWDYMHESIYFIEDYNFCPSCGARMKGADNE